MSKRSQKSSYPAGSLKESQKPSVIKHLVGGNWVEIEAPAKKWVNPKKQHEVVDFYQGRKWLRIRRAVLKKFGRVCMKCGQDEGVIQIDHIKPRSKYPELELVFNNLQVLCMPCNSEKSNKNEHDYRPTNKRKSK